MIKKGMTFAELVMTMGAVFALAALVLPIIRSDNIDLHNDFLRFKKSFYNIETAITDLVSDEALYPLSLDPNNLGYLANTEEVRYEGVIYEGNTKFCNLLAERLSISSGRNCGGVRMLPQGNFTTVDGVVWSLPITDFQNQNRYYPIFIDTNGAEEPNCFESNACEEPDRFAIWVKYDGTVHAMGTIEKIYLENERWNADFKDPEYKANFRTNHRLEPSINVSGASDNVLRGYLSNGAFSVQSVY